MLLYQGLSLTESSRRLSSLLSKTAGPSASGDTEYLAVAFAFISQGITHSVPITPLDI